MSAKKTAIMASFIFLIAIASANFASAAIEWTPLVRIPGLPSTGTVNLSMYLIGLYNFLLSIVGIVAVIMLIIGGMRYITAVGNPTAISSAKEIILNAIVGLVLALLSWVFISTINPDALYIKQPGSAGFSDPATGVHDLATLPVSTSPNFCIAPGSSESPETIYTSYIPPITTTRCSCVDGIHVLAVPGSKCQDVCKVNNCLVADAKIGPATIFIPDSRAVTNAEENATRSSASLLDSLITGPIIVSENSDCQLVLEGERTSTVFHNTPSSSVSYEWDLFPSCPRPSCGYDGTRDVFGQQKYIIIDCKQNLAGWWDGVDANPANCRKKKNDPNKYAWICPIRFFLTDATGRTKEDIVYLGVECPHDNPSDCI
jgi:hypothetical protein